MLPLACRRELFGIVIAGAWATDTATLPEGAVQVPKRFTGTKGMDIHEFNVNWILKPLPEQVSLGYVTLPEGYGLDGENVVEMMEAGIITEEVIGSQARTE